MGGIVTKGMCATSSITSIFKGINKTKDAYKTCNSRIKMIKIIAPIVIILVLACCAVAFIRYQFGWLCKGKGRREKSYDA